jgi:hypothetical protein
MPSGPTLPPSAHPDPPSTPDSTGVGKSTFLSQRTALILFMAIATGIGIGVLTFLSETSYPKAVLAGICAAATCTMGLNTLIE